jgi:hypothetical protein
MDIGRLAASIAFVAVATVGGAAWITGCGEAAPPPLGDHDGGGPPTGDVAAPPPCSTPAESCPCADAGEQYYCGIIYRVSGSHVDCSKGYLTCQSDLTWSSCQGPAIFQGD